MTRMYWDKHGIEGISIRIGSALEQPTEFRHLSTWLGHDDLSKLAQPAPRMPRDAPWSTAVARAIHPWDSQRKSA